MTAGCYKPNNYGVMPGHAYTLLGAYTLKGEKVLKMRNPYALEGYKGPWSDQDPRWTPDLLKKVGHVKA